MHFSIITAFVLGLASNGDCRLSHNAPRTVHNGLTIETTSGQVTGFINDTAPQVRQWLGIPYAEPPVGSLRFAPPKAKSKGKPSDTKKFAPSCMQQFSNGSTIYTEYLTQFLINGGQSEDCLYLNVWAPSAESCKGKNFPVLIYIPGGGFTSGGANSLYKLPDKWIQRTQSHIVVVMNYRVNVFGYPNSKALEDRNPGLLDQRMVVEWTKKNIAGFGGDPEQMMLWGQSAGGASVSLYSYTYPSDPIVKALSSDSGSAGLATTQDVAQTNFTFLAGLVGCGDKAPKAELACMRTVPAVSLKNMLSYYLVSKSGPSISFTPVADDRTVFTNYTEQASKRLVATIPTIMGSNTNEGAGFVAYTPDGPGAETLFKITESVIACPEATEIQNRALAGLTTYRYQYAGNFSNTSPVPWFGAYHSSELPLLFGTHYEYRGDSTPYEYEVSHFMEALWLAFATNPSKSPTAELPSGKQFTWPKYNADQDTMSQFANGSTLVKLVSGDVIDAFC